jgi:sigma-B regulation protein RsbU (phosphoserine phosphatase)
MEPAKEVGGDFYDFFFIDSKRLFFVIGDVSGKGVPASLFMVITKTLLKNQALQGLSPDQILYTVNNQLCLDNDEGMFVTVFCAILDLESGVVEYSNAGHNPPLVYRQGGSYEYMQSKKSFVLGGMENFKYQSNTLTLDLNDAIYLYTDGVTEAMNNQDQLFSEERLKATLFELKQQNEEEILHGVKAAIGDFVKETPQSDDITMLIVKLKQKMNS